MLVHTVYFWLKPELNDEQRAAFRRGVESLKNIKAAEAVYVGAPAATAKRPVVDDSYSVALTVVCNGVAGHDAYQVDPIHLKFVEEFKGYWTRVLIYDAE
jgi:Stress responsive A/B Barrel Domain.